MAKKIFSVIEIENMSDYEFFIVHKLYKRKEYKKISETRAEYLATYDPACYLLHLGLHRISMVSFYTETAILGLVDTKPHLFIASPLGRKKKFRSFRIKAAKNMINYQPINFFWLTFHNREEFFRDEQLARKIHEVAMNMAECNPKEFIKLKLDKDHRFKHLMHVVLKNLDKI